MEILEHGKRYNIHMCKKCDCVFGYLPEDIIKKDDYWMNDTYIEDIELIECPECKNKHYLYVIANNCNVTDEWNKEDK